MTIQLKNVIKILSLVLYLIAFGNIYAYSVSGNVYTEDSAVENALVIFNDDANNSYSTITDSLGNFFLYVGSTAIETENEVITNFELEQNYPNPFAKTTTIPYKLDENSNVNISIYDLLGRKVRQFNAGRQSIGSHKVNWDGCNEIGKKVATGIYFCKLQVGNQLKIKKIAFNASGTGVISLPQSLTTNFSETNVARTESLLSDKYSVIVKNAENTLPYITEMQIDNIIINRDTVMNISADAISVAEVYTDTLEQFIRGFGAANILPWRSDMTDDEIETAFGTDDGELGFSMLRLRLPSDNSSESFSQQVSTAKKASDMGVLIFSSPWSPPASMKSNNNTTGGYLLEENYQDYADYLNEYVDYMEDNGVPIYAVSVQNEPDIEVSYESCDWTAEQMTKFMAENAGTIKTKVIAPESYQFRRVMSDPILNDTVACENLDIVGAHIYGGGLSAYPLAEEKGKEIWMTEHLSGEKDTEATKVWDWAMSAGVEINNCMHAGYNAYVWWYIVRFYGPISDGEYNSGNKGEVTKKGFVMSQFSRFIRPGYYRVQTQKYVQRNVYMSAYTNDEGKIVLVLINKSSLSVDQAIRIDNGLSAVFKNYITSETKDCEKGESINMIKGNLLITLEPSSVTTLVSE